jgi:hypothetical protein
LPGFVPWPSALPAHVELAVTMAVGKDAGQAMIMNSWKYSSYDMTMLRLAWYV